MNQTIGRNLKRVREQVGISQEKFAKRIRLSRATLSAIENGHVAIGSGKLLESANILGCPVSDLFHQDQENLALMYRAAADAVAPAELQVQFEQFCKSYSELEEIVGVAHNLLYPPDYSNSPGIHSKPLLFAEQVARSERDRLGLGQIEPIENIFRLFDEAGLRIFRKPLEDCDVFGLSAFSPQLGACIFVNSENTVERQIFSLAHEYGHTLMHRSFYRSPEPAAGLPKDHELELMANQFAACFLVPESGLRLVFNRDVGEKQVGVEDIVHLKHVFHVSAEMMLRRLADLSLIPLGDSKRLGTELEKRRKPKEEFVPLSPQIIEDWEAHGRFRHLLKRAFIGGQLSVGKLAELLNVPLAQAREFSRAWE